MPIGINLPNRLRGRIEMELKGEPALRGRRLSGFHFNSKNLSFVL